MSYLQEQKETQEKKELLNEIKQILKIVLKYGIDKKKKIEDLKAITAGYGLHLENIISIFPLISDINESQIRILMSLWNLRNGYRNLIIQEQEGIELFDNILWDFISQLSFYTIRNVELQDKEMANALHRTLTLQMYPQVSNIISQYSTQFPQPPKAGNKGQPLPTEKKTFT